jgi:hypothetical protein
MEQKKEMYTEAFSILAGNLKLQGYVVWPAGNFFNPAPQPRKKKN